MIISITNLFIVALFIFGLHAVTREDKIFKSVTKLTIVQGENSFSLASAVSECCTCMSSLYGVVGYFVLMEQIPVFSSTVIYSGLGAVFLSLVEITITHLFYRVQDIKVVGVLRVAKNLVGKSAKSVYVFMLGVFIVEGSYFECVAFTVCLAGLCSLLEWAVILVVTKQQLTRITEAQQELIARSFEDIIEHLKD